MTTRDQIIETTSALLELQGYHATGLNEIVQRSGAPKGSLYHYFPGGKDALTIEALQSAGARVRERLETYLNTAQPSADAVRVFILALAAQVETMNYQGGGPITTVALETAATHDGLRETCRAIYAEWQVVFRDCLLRGGIAAERAERLSIFILAALEGSILLARTQRSTTPLILLADELHALIASVR